MSIENTPTLDPRPEAWRSRMSDTPRMLREIAEGIEPDQRFSARLLRMLADDTEQMMREGVHDQLADGVNE